MAIAKVSVVVNHNAVVRANFLAGGKVCGKQACTSAHNEDCGHRDGPHTPGY